MTDKLFALRQKIDLIDDRILLLLKDRIDLMEAIGKIKKLDNQDIRDDKRENEKIEIIKKKAVKLNLPRDFIIKLWDLIFLESEKIEG